MWSRTHQCFKRDKVRGRRCFVDIHVLWIQLSERSILLEILLIILLQFPDLCALCWQLKTPPPTTPPKLRYFWQWGKTQQKVGWQKTDSTGRTTQGLGRFGKQVWLHQWTRVPGLGKGCTMKSFSKGVSGHSWEKSLVRAQDTRLCTWWLVYPFHDHNRIRLCCTYCCLCWMSRGNNSHQGSAVLRALLKCSIGLGFFWGNLCPF